MGSRSPRKDSKPFSPGRVLTFGWCLSSCIVLGSAVIFSNPSGRPAMAVLVAVAVSRNSVFLMWTTPQDLAMPGSTARLRSGR